jgi:hypothetical protein
MPRKISIAFIFTVVLAMVALFAATDVTAQDCTITNGGCETLKGLTITLVGNAPQKNTSNCPGVDNWECIYEVCKPGTGGPGERPSDSKGFNHFNLAIPDCCPDKIILIPPVISDENLRVYSVGAGDPTTKFERGD